MVCPSVRLLHGRLNCPLNAMSSQVFAAAVSPKCVSVSRNLIHPALAFRHAAVPVLKACQRQQPQQIP